MYKQESHVNALTENTVSRIIKRELYSDDDDNFNVWTITVLCNQNTSKTKSSWCITFSGR